MEITRDPRKFFTSDHKIRDASSHTLPQEFWMVQGSGESQTSPLNAFDASLLSAGISGLNLVTYSSVIPLRSNYLETEIEVEHGSQVGCILARAEGETGEKLNSGLVIARYDEYFIVYEGHSKGPIEALESNLLAQIHEAVSMRGGGLEHVLLVTNSLIVTERYGCCIVAVIFNPLTYL